MEFLTNFGVQPTLLLAQIVNFVIILILLKKFFYRPIVKILDDRKKRIEESLKNAELTEQRLRQTEEKSALVLKEAINQSQKIIEGAKKEAATINAQANADAKKTLEETLIKANAQIASEKEAMSKALEKETLTLAIEIARRVLSRQLSQKERQTLTSRSLSEITGQI